VEGVTTVDANECNSEEHTQGRGAVKLVMLPLAVSKVTAIGRAREVAVKLEKSQVARNSFMSPML